MVMRRATSRDMPVVDLFLYRLTLLQQGSVFWSKTMHQFRQTRPERCGIHTGARQSSFFYERNQISRHLQFVSGYNVRHVVIPHGPRQNDISDRCIEVCPAEAISLVRKFDQSDKLPEKFRGLFLSSVFFRAAAHARLVFFPPLEPCELTPTGEKHSFRQTRLLRCFSTHLQK